MLVLFFLLRVLLLATRTKADDDLVSELLKEEAAGDGEEQDEPSKKASGRRQKKRSASFKGGPRKVHPLTDLPDEEEGVETSYSFPDHVDLRFPIGGEVTALCHLRNGGSGPLNVTFIMGSLNAPFDFSHHMMNFSYKPVGIQLPPGFEATLSYPFKLDSKLESMEYQMAHTVFYENEKESFSSTFFNKTVELYHPPTEFDVAILRTIIGLVVPLGVFLHLFNKFSKPRSQSAGGTRQKELPDWGEEFRGGVKPKKGKSKRT